MQVTNLQVYPIREHSGRLRAYARVVLDNALQLTGLRVYDGNNGLFVSYPNDPNYRGDDYRQIFYPVTQELREHIEQKVLGEYLSAMGESVPTPEITRSNIGEQQMLTFDIND